MKPSRLRVLLRKLRKPATIPFHTLPYAQRVQTIQGLYAHENNLSRFERYFATNPISESVYSPFYDIILGYARVMQPAAIHQIGCFTATESCWLVDNNVPGSIVASDFDSVRLDYLRKRFQGTPYERIEFRLLDLESRDYQNLQGADMVVAYAVMSNVQPESVDYFFSTLVSNGISLLVLRDITTKESLTASDPNANSWPSQSDTNWYHPYLALAARHHLDAFYLPELVYSCHTHASCICVIHHGLSEKTHTQALSSSVANYLARQAVILRSLRAAER